MASDFYYVAIDPKVWAKVRAAFRDIAEIARTKRHGVVSQSLFGVHEIPSDNQIRNLLDPAQAKALFPVFESIWQVLERGGQLDPFRNVEKTLLVALDGTEYFSSEKIHSKQCSSRVQKSRKRRDFHSVVTPVVVSPNQPYALPLVPEFVTPQDGHEQQDCEIAASKCWLDTHGERLREWKVTMLGDDLYCRQPLCEQLVEAQLDFIFVCRDTSAERLPIRRSPNISMASTYRPSHRR